MKKTKVLLLSHFFYPHTGGIEIVTALLAEEFYKNECQVIVVTWTKNNEKDNFPFNVIRHPSIYKLIKYFLWADIILENNPCLRLSWPGFIFRKPNIIVLQTWLNHESKAGNLQQILKRKKLSLANKVIAISSTIKENIWPSATIIHNPYNETIFQKKNDLERKPTFVFVGRLVSDKGVAIAINAMHKLIYVLQKNTFADEQPLLTIIGNGAEMENLRQLVYKLQMQDYIYFTGGLRSKQICEELNKHKYLLVPSIWEEPFGIVALEGMACGCIPIVSHSGGLPEAVENAGITFVKNDQDSLVNKICSIEHDKYLQQKIIENAPQQLKNHSAAKISQDYLSIIKLILEAKS